MSKKTWANALKVLALILDVGTPLVAVLVQFPVFIERSSSATVSGISLILILLCAIPLRNRIKAFMKSPSVPVLWTLLFIASVAFNQIIQEVIVIAFVGMVSNAIGTLLNFIAKSIIGRDKNNG